MSKATSTPRARAVLVPAAAALLLLIAATACGDDTESSDRQPSPIDGPDGATDDAGKPDARGPGSADPCADEDAGADCGDGRVCADGKCVRNICGDGIQAGDEECDDGNENDGDGCTPSCRTTDPSCMDGTQQAGEECDDGNWFDDDACANDCTENVCGNERIDRDEECDDGNRVDDDGCSNACTENKCRNGRVDPGEACDDGNLDHHDGCSNACEVVWCGNGELEGEEECDDGNQVDGDACANVCTKNECGNMRIDPGEVCDGDSSAGTCSGNCSELIENDCRPCEEAQCHNWLDTDPVSNCYAAENPLDAQLCTDVVDCALRNHCANDVDQGLSSCFCGEADATACQADMGVNGPCIPQMIAAAKGTTNMDVIERISDTGYPLGWARLAVECQLWLCVEECGHGSAP